jgi:hypothetical protein
VLVIFCFPRLVVAPRLLSRDEPNYRRPPGRGQSPV